MNIKLTLLTNPREQVKSKVNQNLHRSFRRYPFNNNILNNKIDISFT